MLFSGLSEVPSLPWSANTGTPSITYRGSFLPLMQLPPRTRMEDPAPGISLSRFGPDGYELDLGFWIADPENGQGGVVSEINKKVYALVQSGTVKLGFPSVDTRLLDSHIASVVARITQPAQNS